MAAQLLLVLVMRVPRRLSVFPGHSVHKVWRGHNREFNLETPEMKLKYLEFLNADLESEKYEAGAYIEALTLMSSHTHEMFKILQQMLFSDHMRRHHSRYGAYFNKLQGRCGKVAQDRPHTTLLYDEQREMETVFYIHANPVRANMVKDAKDYRFSTHRLYAFGIREEWMRNVKLPDWYMKLGRTAEFRQRAYRRLFARYLKRTGRYKQNFLRERFFGPVDWVQRHEAKISSWRKEQQSFAPS